MHWHPQALEDYVQHGTHDDVDSQGRPCRTLSFDREIETHIYNTLPHNLGRWLRKYPLQCEVAFIAGTRSKEMRQVSLTMTRKVVGTDHLDRIRYIEGSHLFPMERPEETAAQLDELLKSLAMPRMPMIPR